MEKEYKTVKEIAKEITNIMQLKDNQDDSTVREWLKSGSDVRNVLDVLSDEEKLSEIINNFDRKELCETTSQALVKRLIKIKRKKQLRRISSGIAAAVVTVSMIVWIGFYKNNDTIPHKNQTEISEYISFSNVDVPTLILSSGQGINLNNVSEKINHITVSKNRNEIEYKKTDTISDVKSLNTLLIPSKHIYTIILSDGTKVMLNANSKLIYPVTFNKNKREVEIDGEGYFEVAKSNIPFIVKVKGVDIKVYGTKFNVNSYGTNNIETVLISGSIGVRLANNEQVLKPNQLYNLNTLNEESKLQNIDAKAYISWIDGTIKSYNSSLWELITKLSNWYGVSFDFFDKHKKDLDITASFDMQQTIESVIQAIEFSLKVKIVKMEGGYIIY